MDSLPIRYRLSAVDELADAIEWYGQRSEKAANDLRDLVRAKLAEAAHSLNRWPLQRDGTRQIYLGSFPYLLVVREINGTLEVVAVAHTSRNLDIGASGFAMPSCQDGGCRLYTG